MRTAARMLATKTLQPAPPPIHAAAGAVRRNNSSSVQAVQQQQASAATTALDVELRKVAEWRLALLRGPHITDVAMQLKGVTFDNRQGLLAQCQPGQGLLICKEPSNPADPHAVAVYTAGMQQLGYLPRATAQQWQLQTCFGRVLSMGQAVMGPDRLWGATVQCKPAVRGLCLDLLPDAWQAQAADLTQLLEDEQQQQQQQQQQPSRLLQVLEQYDWRCAVSSAPQDELQQPLRVVPEWGFDYIRKQVQLVGLLPLCAPLDTIRQQLAAVADQLADLAPDLQLEAPQGGAADHSSSSGSGGSGSTGAAGDQQGVVADSSATAAAALHEHHAGVAAAAVGALPEEQQEALRWLAILTQWRQVDCVRYVAYAGWRRQHLLPQGGWTFVKPDGARLDAVIASQAAVDGHVVAA